MGDLSPSVRLKLDRAEEHARELESLILNWGRKPEPYRFVTEIEDDSDPFFVHYRYFIRTTRPLPGDRLSKVFGDCIHNYRAVLDHLIWELSVEHARQAGVDVVEPHRVKFPSAITGRGSGGLHAVGPDVRTAVEGLFRDCACKEPGMPSPFWMLCELSNVDKHRTVHVIHHYTRPPEIYTIPTIIGTRVELLEPDELEDETLLARITVPRPVATAEVVEVRSRTLNGVAIPSTESTPRAHLGLMVDSFGETVKEAAKRLGRLLP